MTCILIFILVLWRRCISLFEIFLSMQDPHSGEACPGISGNITYFRQMTLISLESSSDSHMNTESLLYDQLCMFKSGCSSVENRPPAFIEKENPIATYIYSKVTVSTAFLIWFAALNSNKQLLFQLLLLPHFFPNHCCTSMLIMLVYYIIFVLVVLKITSRI